MQNERTRLELQRLVVAANPATLSSMKRYAAAAALLISGKRGCDMQAPEPLVQVGFEPDDNEMLVLTFGAEQTGRDLIHISCHPDGSGRPTGMIAVVYFEDGKAHAHRRAGLLSGLGKAEVILSGVSDVEDEPCHFRVIAGGKMVRVPGHPVDDVLAGMHRAGEFWHSLARSPELRDCDDELLTMYSMVEASRDPVGRTEQRIGKRTAH